MDVEKRTEISAAAFDAAAASLAWAERARRSLPPSPPEGTDEAEVLAWAEDTLETMTELSELMAEAWERIAVAMEAVARVARHDATLEPSPEALEDTADGDRADEDRAGEPGEPTAEDLLGPTSFLDALNEAPPGSTHAA